LDGKPVFCGDTKRLLGGDVDFDTPFVIDFYPGVFAVSSN
jgi:hypothetical protein